MQVLEDVGGTARLENTKTYGALLAKQSSEQAALRCVRTLSTHINLSAKLCTNFPPCPADPFELHIARPATAL